MTEGVSREVEERLIKLIERLGDERLQKMLMTIAENSAPITEMLEQLVELKKTRVLDALIQIASLIYNIYEQMMTSEGVKTLVEATTPLLILAREASDEDVVKRLSAMVNALASITEYRPVGLLGLLNALRDPDVQRGLGFLIAFLKALGRQLE